MSRFSAMIYGFFFGGAQDFERVGAFLDADDDVRNFAVHCTTIADYKAHVEVLNCMGVNALKPCPCCRKLVAHNKMPVHIQGEGIHPITNTYPATWVLHSDATMAKLYHKLRNAALHTPSQLAELETLHGMRDNPHSVIALPEYKAISTLMYDWMHCWAIDGVYRRCFESLFELLHEKAKEIKKPFAPQIADIEAYRKIVGERGNPGNAMPTNAKKKKNTN